MLEIILIAFSLSADACAVTISNALAYKNSTKIKFCPIYFGLFQGIMPLIGYYFVKSISNNLWEIGSVIVFVLLAFIGAKMICEGIFDKEEAKDSKLKHKTLLIEAFATSVDAMAVGISFCFMSINIVYASFLIAIVTAIVCVIAIALAYKIPQNFSSKFEIVGGIILILIAIKSLII